MKEVIFAGNSGSPDSPEWHAWRARGLGGSDAPAIAADAGLVGRTQWMATLQQLWEEKLGLRVRPKNTFVMNRGKVNEEPARQQFELQTGIVVSPTFGEMDAHPEIRVSFDGLSYDRRIIAEVKHVGKEVHAKAKLGQSPDYYEAQIAHQCMVAWGEPSNWPADGEAYLVAYNMDPADIAIVRYGPGDDASMFRMSVLQKLATNMLPLLLNFWKHVETKTPPGQNVDEWTYAALQYRKAEEAEAAAKASKEAAKEVLLSLVGDSPKKSGAGITVSTYPQQGAVDYKKVLETVVPVSAVEEILKASGIEVTEIHHQMMDQAKLTEEQLKPFRAPESKRTKISVEKDYIPPLADPVTIAINTDKSEKEGEAYAW